jgi:hypothetical protein
MDQHDELRNVKNQFTFALATHHSCSNQLIRPENYAKKFKVDTGGIGLTIEHKYDQAALNTLSKNNLIAAVGICAIQIDSVFEQVYGKLEQRTNYADPDVAALCLIMFLLRCAFAHNIVNPKWDICKPEYKKEIVINSIGVTLDTTDLHEKGVVPAQYGGHEGFVRMVDFAMSLIKKGSQY